MNAAVRKQLILKAKSVAEIFSNPNREKNSNKEHFSLTKIVPYSEHSAAVSFTKMPSNKLALAFFYFNNNRWFYFFPNDSVIQGMMVFGFSKQKVEQANFILDDIFYNKKMLKGDYGC